MEEFFLKYKFTNYIQNLSWNNLSIQKKTLKNIFSLFIFRGGNICLQLLLVPVSIKFVSSSSYGLWLTASSMITWMNILDIGLSSGLRNKLSESISNRNLNLSKSYISTTYFLLIILSLVGLLISGILIFSFNWNRIISIPSSLGSSNFHLFLVMISTSFFIIFLLKPIASIAYAVHKPYIEYLILFIGSLVNLIIIWVVNKIFFSGNILVLGAIFCLTPIVVNYIFSLWLYNTIFKDFKPSPEYINLKYAKSLLGLGLKFFIIQISATVIFATNNVIISHYFGNNSVTAYNIATKYFNILIFLQSMILIPFWTLFTEANLKKDKIWISKIMKKLFRIALLFSLITIFMIFISNYIFKIWIGKFLIIPMSLTIIVGITTILTFFAGVFTTFLSGTGNVTFHMFTSFVPMILHIPLTLFVVNHWHLGIAGIVGMGGFWLMMTIPLRYIQYKMIISYKYSSGIWVS